MAHFKTIKTSIEENREREIFAGFSLYAVKFGLFGVMIGLSLNSYATHLSGKPSAFLVLGAGIIAFYLGQKLLSGRYDFENREKIMNQVTSTLLPETAEIDLCSEQPVACDSRSISTEKGRRLYMFKFGLVETSLLHDVAKSLFSRLPTGTEIQFVRQTTQQLSPKGVKSSLQWDLYLCLDFYDRGSKTDEVVDEQATLLSAVASPLGPKAALEVIRKMAIGESVSQLGDEPQEVAFHAPIALLRKEGKLHSGHPSKASVCFSMANFPELIGPYFQNIIGSFGCVEGSLSVKFTVLRDMDPFSNLVRTRIIEKTGGRTKKVDSWSRRRLGLQIGGAFHGDQADLKELGQRVTRAISCVDQPERPFFTRESLYLKATLLSLLPGFGRMLKERVFEVLSEDEAVRFIPETVDHGSTEPTILFEREDGSSFGWLFKAMCPLFIAGKIGAGKSAFISMIIMAFIRIGKNRKERRATFVLESGGSMKFLSGGIADVEILMKERVDGGLEPLAHNPVHMLQSLGVKGKIALANWLATISGLGNIIANTAAIKDILVDDDSLLTIEDVVKKLRSVPGRKGNNSEIANSLEIYCSSSNSQESILFDPPPNMEANYSEALHFYCSQIETTDKVASLDGAFIHLAKAVLQATSANFSRPGPQQAAQLIVIDEFQELKSYLDLETLRLINSRARRQEKYIISASQSISDTVDKFSNGNEYHLTGSFLQFFFANSESKPEHWIGAAKNRSNQDEFIEKIEKAAAKRSQLLLERGLYSWCHIDPDKNVNLYILRMSKEDEWLTASFTHAKNLRSMVMERTGLSFWQACKALAAWGPKKLPQDNPYPQESIERLCDKIQQEWDDYEK